MFGILWTERICSIGMLLFFTASIVVLVFLARKYNELIKEAENMSVTKRKELKAIKTKFLNSYGSQDTEEQHTEKINVEVFVDKAISRLKICGQRPHIWKFLSQQCLLVSIMFAGIGCFRGMIEKKSVREISPFYVLVFMAVYVYFSVLNICDFEGKQKMLALTVIEYVENHMLKRIQTAKAFLEEEQLVAQQKQGQQNTASFSEEKELELEHLLEEFLV